MQGSLIKVEQILILLDVIDENNVALLTQTKCGKDKISVFIPSSSLAFSVTTLQALLVANMRALQPLCNMLRFLTNSSITLTDVQQADSLILLPSPVQQS